MGPPPNTSRRWGNSRRPQRVSLVSTPASCRPGSGGTTGRAPVAMTMARVDSLVAWPSSWVISTCQGSTMRARPSCTSTPRLR